jgi:CheY-like chemotaxis protein
MASDNNAAVIVRLAPAPAVQTVRTLRTVMVVANNPDERVLETIADEGGCDVVVVESMARGYSQVKRIVPQLVVVCLDLDGLDGYHVLSMLKLDRATCHIPVVTCMAPRPPSSVAQDGAELPEDDMRAPRAAVPMH